jgi:hypothetical protein
MLFVQPLLAGARTIMAGNADFFGVPEFFITNVSCESAGRGNVRVYCSSLRGNELVPQYSVVMSIVDLMEATAVVRKRAAEIWNETVMPVPTLELN